MQNCKNAMLMFAISGVALVAAASSNAQDKLVDAWNYSLRKPAADWIQPDFDDADWSKGSGGFGTSDTPGSRVGTTWSSNNIWLRKQFELTSMPVKPALLMHHDEDVEIYINGQLVLALQGFSTQYEVVPLNDQQLKSLKSGLNVLAVYCRQSGGGQFIDAHVVDAEKIPKLPAVVRNTQPYRSELITQWGAQVTADNAWREYPRPQMQRKQWTNLNGLWDYAITSVDQKTVPAEWAGKLLVPFCLESKLGGVQRLLLETEALWYRRTISLPPKNSERTMLNFEAVDYRCDVFVNGVSVGSHQGGNTPFAVDISQALRSGDNELVVRVEDETEAWQLHGKQVTDARGIWYTQVSGIWQTVWLEQLGPSYIEDLTIHTDASAGTIQIRPEVVGGRASPTLRLVVKDGQRVVAQTQNSDELLSVTISDAKLWSPDSPFLYDLEVTLLDENNQVLDQVKSYAGIRSVGKQRSADGHLRLTLNGHVLFHLGPLDQGWWPDGLLTPPSDQAMRFDIQFLKSAGFNMIRKHIKVEPRRYYYHCDRLGMMVWQDQVSASHNPKWTRLDPNPEDAVWPDPQHAQFMLELERMIDNLESHPSIVMWVPFNEAWGQHRTLEVGKWTVERDPSRLVNVASGGNFWPVGDIVDHHSYPHPEFPFDSQRYVEFVQVVGEFGGHGFPVQGHLWNINARNWGYGDLPKNEQEYKQRYATSLEILRGLKQQGIAAGVYTQTTDVEGEINGLMSYDRKVIKISSDELAKLHRPLLQPIPAAP